MKKHVLIFVLLLHSLCTAQIVNIPDSDFKFTLVNFPCVDTNGDGQGDSDADTNNDGEIQVSEAESVQGLYFYNHNLESFEGLQSFVNLLALNFSCDNLTSFDLSQNILLEYLSFSGESISTLNLNQNVGLKSLGFGSTLIEELDLTQNQFLEFLNCSHSPLTSIDISQNVNLIILGCTYTPLTEIDLSGNPNLEEVLLRFNQLTSLDISNLNNLRELNFNLNQITELDVSNNLNLESLIIDNNIITSLDLSLNPNLFRLTVSNNNLSSLNLKNGNTNIITKMWAHENPNLTCIQVDDVSYPDSQICTSWDGWCKDETAVYSEDCTLGLEEVLESQISIYPNPAKDVLYLYNESASVVTTVKVYDSLGKLVLEQINPSNIIDIANLSNGLLFIQIETDEGIITKKVIKE
jgi:Leucine-rich repeat (LRR) protein